MSESVTRAGQERFVADVSQTPLEDVDAFDLDKAPEGQWKEVWKRLRKDWIFWLSVLILIVVALMIVVPQLFTSADPNYKDLGDSLEPARQGAPFGFDRQGGNVWARTIYGARASVAVGVLTTLIVALLGIVTGSIAGFYGKWVDSAISRVSDVFFSIPLLLASIVVVSVINNLYPDRGFWGSVGVIVLALGAFAWPQITRQMRGAVLEVRSLEFVDAATAIGASRLTNLRRHIVPNSLAPVIVTSTISLGVFIVAESTLSFLGIGLPSGVVSWGNDIADAQTLVRSGQNLTVMWVPATALAITVLGFILLGESVREAIDPKARKQ
jgi:oligopeptide transport system permease protein